MSKEGDLDNKILQKYRSLEQPRLDFVREEFLRDPYRELIEVLAKLADVEEDTDLNTDVSFGLRLKSGVDMFFVQLSMVGPFACVLQIKDSATALVEPNETSDLSPLGAELIKSVLNYGLEILGSEDLEKKIPLRKANFDPDKIKYYNVLFSYEELLPWESR